MPSGVSMAFYQFASSFVDGISTALKLLTNPKEVFVKVAAKRVVYDNLPQKTKKTQKRPKDDDLPSPLMQCLISRDVDKRTTDASIKANLEEWQNMSTNDTLALQTFQDWTKHIDAFKENIENTVQAGDITADTHLDPFIPFYLDISEKAFIYTMPPIKQPATEMFERIKETVTTIK